MEEGGGKKRARKLDARLLLDADEMAALDSQAKEAGFSSRSAYLRRLIAGNPVVRVDAAPLREYVYLIRNAANNVNQIARKANTSGAAVREDVLALAESVSVLKANADEVAAWLSAIQ